MQCRAFLCCLCPYNLVSADERLNQTVWIMHIVLRLHRFRCLVQLGFGSRRILLGFNGSSRLRSMGCLDWCKRFDTFCVGRNASWMSDLPGTIARIVILIARSQLPLNWTSKAVINHQVKVKKKVICNQVMINNSFWDILSCILRDSSFLNIFSKASLKIISFPIPGILVFFFRKISIKWKIRNN